MILSSVVFNPLRIAALLLGCAALAGCAGFSSDGGFNAVADAARTQLKLEVRWPRSGDERAKRDDRVTGLEADLVQAGRLPNPRFTLRHSSGGGLYDIEETLTFNVLSLVTAPYVHAAEERRFAQVQSAVIIEVVRLADRTRTAYYTALAAGDSLRYAWQVKSAAQISAELAHRMLGAGNWNRLDQTRQQSFYAQALQQLTRAQSADETARTELNRLLGVDDERPAVQLAERLPDLPQDIVELPNLERTALQNRIDLRLMRSEVDELAHRLKLTKATRFVDVLDLGPTRVRNGARQDPFETGYEVSLVVPIFDTGDARVRKSEAIYAQSVERLAQAAIDARSDVRTAISRYRAAFETAARERDEIVPLAKLISQQNLLRYNASQISVFDLLADARAQIASVNAYIDSVRDFWIAKSRLDTALIADSSS
jgi:outer membrane protein TolC